jgi:hypothetical protein
MAFVRRRRPSPVPGLVPTSLGAARALPPRVRRQIKRDVVFFQIEELNAVYDLLRARRADRGLRERSQAIARERVERVLRATRMISAVAIENAWAFAELEVERPEDVFGPAVVLLGLAPTDSRVRQWVTTMPVEVRAALAAVGIASGEPSSGRPGRFQRAGRSK